MTNISILHVSDVHFGMPDHTAEQDRIVANLIDAARGANIRPDLCVFSGDLAHSGGQKEFEQGEEWLRRLLEPWPNLPLLVVPGNHDARRKDAAPDIIRPAATSEKKLSPSQR
jgi:3',5'-cyclic AMP phosphodiesterase CpdA